MQDFRYALRYFLRTPGFTLAAILSLSLGIGSATAMFSVVNAVLFKTLPVREPGQLVNIATYDPNVVIVYGRFPKGANGEVFRLNEYRRMTEGNQALEGLAARSRTAMSFNSGGDPIRVRGEVVSGNFFDLLGVRPAVGRLFSAEDDRAEGASPVCVLSFGFWQRYFGSDRGVIGKKVRLNSGSFEIAGVMPKDFAGLDPGDGLDVAVPLSMHKGFSPASVSQINDEVSWLHVVGRMKPGASISQTQDALQGLWASIRPKEPEKSKGPSRLVLNPGSQGSGRLRTSHEKTLALLMAAVGILLLTACANVANLLLSRAAARSREIAVRLAVGASRRRLIRQLLSESLLLAFAGGGAGVLATYFVSEALARLVLQARSSDTPIAVPVDGAVLAFTLGTSLLVGLLFGLAPALTASRPDLTSALKGTSTGSSIRRFSLRNGLVVLQVALSVVLLAGAGLLVRSLDKLRSADLGFVRENLALFSISPEEHGYSPEARANLMSRLAERLQALPGTRAVGYSDISPMSGNLSMSSFDLPGSPYEPGGEQLAYVLTASPGFFAAIGTPLAAGREFTDRDREGAPRVALVNEKMARRFWPGRSAVGQFLTGRANSQIEIVGVVKDSKYRAVTEPDHYSIYFPWLQRRPSSATVHVRASGNVTALMASVRQELKAIDPNLPIFGIRTMETQIEDGLLLERMLSVVSAFFSGLALLMAAVGLYGVMAYAVTRRTREIGIRMALGAMRGDVLASVMRECAILGAIGIVLGIPAAIASARAIQSFLFGVHPGDTSTYTAVAAGLLVVAIAAGLLPARRASQVDPMIALRQD